MTQFRSIYEIYDKTIFVKSLSWQKLCSEFDALFFFQCINFTSFLKLELRNGKPNTNSTKSQIPMNKVCIHPHILVQNKFFSHKTMLVVLITYNNWECMKTALGMKSWTKVIEDLWNWYLLFPLIIKKYRDPHIKGIWRLEKSCLQ